jgi:4-amino-4-deoxy-L-arabinose transferase-like glycosyltransferase
VLLGGALALRLWGVEHGMPYAYNIDEAAQFVPRAIAMTGFRLNPHYFANPPALTYLLHVIFMVRYGSHAAAVRAFETHPAQVYTIARVTVAVLGVISLWLLYVLGSRLLDRRVALLATALAAVAFLPVFYSHLALNDVPTLVPLLVSLIGSAGVMQQGRTRDYLLAGIGLGVGAATKYTAGVVVVALLAAVAIRLRASRSRGEAPRRALEGLLLAGVVALLAFLVANPYALLDFHSFIRELGHESSVAEEAAGKLGAPHQPTVVYYLWSFTWGLGWVPALAALGGAVTVWRRDSRVGWLLVPMSVVYLVFMSTEGRAFGRWLMPILPVACLLAAQFAFALVDAAARALARTRPRRRLLAAGAAGAFLAVALLGQGMVYAVHSDLVLARADTRNLARAWMVAHVPAGERIVLEPGVVEAAWPRVRPAPGAISHVPNLWTNYPLSAWLIAAAPAAASSSDSGAHHQDAPAAAGTHTRETGRRATPAGGDAAPAKSAAAWRYVHYYGREEQYARTLTPGLIAYYEQHGYCWVVSGSTQSARALADPAAVPQAVAYYRALSRRATVAYHVSPYDRGSRPVRFSYDWSFDYYPLSYRRAGPEVTVYHLRSGTCGSRAAPPSQVR